MRFLSPSVPLLFFCAVGTRAERSVGELHMAPKVTSTKGSTATTKQLKTSKISAQPRASTLGRYNTWHVEQEYKPQRKISDEELAAAKKMFFALDGDSSGSIDAEELGVMLRSLGQNPTEQELAELIVCIGEARTIERTLHLCLQRLSA